MNLQNIPRVDPVVKRAMRPKLDALVSFDYSQIEPRLLAYFAAKLGDTQLADVYAAGDDVYRVTAGAILDKPPLEVTADERQLYGKVTFLSIVYGAGPKKIAEVQDIPYAEAKQYYLSFHENLPCVRMISNPPPRSYRSDYVPGAVERVLLRRGYIETPWGRRLSPGQWEDHKMLNKLIQGTAADIMKSACVELWKWQRRMGPKSHFVLTVHDDVLFDATSDEIKLLAETVPRIMTLGWKHKELSDVLALEVEQSVSHTTWADLEPYNPEDT